MTEGPGTVNSIVIHHALGHHSAMRRVYWILLPLILAGCLPLGLYYRAGVPVSRLNADQTNCEVRALRDAPVATQIRRTPSRFVPGRRICDATGACVTRPGYWIEGDYYTVDVNENLRERVLDMCMAEKGYRPVRIPPCSQAVVRAAPQGVTTTLPRLTEKSCVIRNKGGSWQIVNPL
jgi:hypothetical protein